MSTKLELQFELDDLRSRVEQAHAILGDALGLEIGDEVGNDEEEDEDAV